MATKQTTKIAPTNTMQKPTPKPKIPSKAEAEIMEVLARDMRISTDQIVSILKKHEVCADSEKLQDSYRKRVGQRLMASIRDENGKRELLSAKADYSGNEYIVIDACNNIRQLQQIKYKLQKNIAGLDASISKVNCRLGFFEHFSQKLLLFRRK